MMHYELNNPPAICEVVDGEVIVINLDSGSYHSMRKDAAGVWSALIAGYPLDIIARSASAPSDEASRSLRTFVDKLVALGILRAAHGAPTKPPTQLVSWVPAALNVESFDDMQDLLGLDPVHEVDLESGWPAKSL